MSNTPEIVVQLIHIEGPLKGEIQEYSAPEIYIGRQSSCQVRFPKDFSIVSRKHAKICREGNRFKMTDESSNGTYLNGNKTTEAYLKDGDVLMFAEGGPKVSFLTAVGESMVTSPAQQPPGLHPRQSLNDDSPHESSRQAPRFSASVSPGRESHINAKQDLNDLSDVDSEPPKVNVPLVIQYGPTLQSFKELPVVIGKNPDCDFIINQPSVLDQHAQIYFKEDQYRIKDLTGKQCVGINGCPINGPCVLNPEDILTLSDQGPSFRFLGGGRLAEAEQPASVTPAEKTPENDMDSDEMENKKTNRKKAGSLLKKIFS